MSGLKVAVLNLDQNDRLICASNPVSGVRLRMEVPPDTLVGTILDYQWLGFAGAWQNPIGETLHKGSVQLTAEDIRDGVSKTIEYFTHVKPIRIGSAIADCKLAGGGAAEHKIRVHLENGLGQTCDEV